MIARAFFTVLKLESIEHLIRLFTVFLEINVFTVFYVTFCRFDSYTKSLKIIVERGVPPKPSSLDSKKPQNCYFYTFI